MSSKLCKLSGTLILDTATFVVPLRNFLSLVKTLILLVTLKNFITFKIEENKFSKWRVAMRMFGRYRAAPAGGDYRQLVSMQSWLRPGATGQP